MDSLADFSVDSALNILRMLDVTNDPLDFDFEMFVLHNLRAFLICSRKLWDGARLTANGNNTNNDGENQPPPSLLLRIVDPVCRFGDLIQPYSPCSVEKLRGEVGLELSDFVDKILSFREEIDEYYDIILSDCSRRSGSPTSVELEEIFYIVLHVLGPSFTRPIEMLKEKLTLLMHLISFAKPVSTDAVIQQTEGLLAHVEAFAVGAAHIVHRLKIREKGQCADMCDRMDLKISELLQKIKPIEPTDPRVREIYTRALTSFKLSTRLCAASVDVLANFTEFLACNLWEVLLLEPGFGTAMMDRLQELYQGLRHLRLIFKNHPSKFHEELKNLALFVICDAGVTIFSVPHKDVEPMDRDIQINLGILDLLERIEIIEAEVGEEVQVPKISTFSCPKTDELGFLDSLIEHLTELTSSETDSHFLTRIETVREDLVFLRSFLDEISDLRSKQEGLQALWNRVLELAYRVEFLIDRLAVGNVPDSLSPALDSTAEDIKGVKTDALVFNDKREAIKKVTRTSSTHSQMKSSSPMADHVVGFDVEAASIIHRLTGGSKQLRVVSIVGMAGQGKTTLANKVYNDPSVVCHFHLLAWCSISQAFDKKKALLGLLNHISPDRYVQESEDNLAERLRRCLKGRRYLIFLDDIWDIEPWNSLNLSLPDDSNGSRIILTSRHRDVVPRDILDEEPHLLRQLTDGECWDLLQWKIFREKCYLPAHRLELGMKIAAHCKGLPLTVVVVAGILATMEPEGWEQVLATLKSGAISGSDQCLSTVELSYKHLPDYLKPCFLYFGAFPEDEEVSIKWLVRLWIGEGFVRKTVEAKRLEDVANESKRLEDVANEYIMDLVRRSLVMVVEQRSLGHGVKTCRIHDLLHDFCRAKAVEENFCRVLKGCDGLSNFNNGQSCLRRLVVFSKREDFKDSKLFCPCLRSLLFYDEKYDRIQCIISFIAQVFKLLKVLDIRDSTFRMEIMVFPSELERLLLLRYLAISGMIRVIPPSIVKLSKLEVFILVSNWAVSLPGEIWSLKKLRHLYFVVKVSQVGFVLPDENLDDTPNLCELESFSGAIISSWQSMEKHMRKFQNVRRLRCQVFQQIDLEDGKKILIPDFLSQLESLNLQPFHTWENYTEFEFSFPANIKKLTLGFFGLPWSKISAIGKLPNLEVLKLLDGSFSGETWDVEEGEFSKLRVLKLKHLDIVRWIASDDQFPCLEKLTLSGCEKLEEIPSCLEYLPTLEMIELRGCTDPVESSVRQIQDVQMDLGNSDLKIHFHSGW